MAKSWATFFHNFNESSQHSMKVFSVLNFQFELNFISFCLFYDQNILLHANIAVTYSLTKNLPAYFASASAAKKSWITLVSGSEAGQEVSARLCPRPLRPQPEQHRRGRPRLQEEVRILWNPHHRKRKNGR